MVFGKETAEESALLITSYPGCGPYLPHDFWLLMVTLITCLGSVRCLPCQVIVFPLFIVSSGRKSLCTAHT